MSADNERQIKKMNLASGSVMNRDQFNLTTWDSSSQHGVKSTGYKDMMREAMRWFRDEPYISKAVRLLSQLSQNGFTITSEDDAVELFFKSWWEDIGGDKLAAEVFLDLFKVGNVFPVRKMVKYTPKKANLKQKRRVSPQGGDVNSGWRRNMLPAAYALLNPLAISAPSAGDFPGAVGLVYKLNAGGIKKGGEAVKYLPDPIAKAIRNGNDKVLLGIEDCPAMFMGKQAYEPFATPIVASAFDSLNFKSELRTMDVHTVRGVRNRILQVTIGNDKFPVTDSSELQRLASDFNNPSRNMTIFWNHTLDVKYVEPNLESLSMDKYEPVMDDIRSAFGISSMMTGGSGDGAIGSNVMNIKGMAEMVNEAQNIFIKWLMREINMVCMALGIESRPEVSFNKLNLKDENDFARVLMQMVDRQLISYDTASTTLGFNFGREKSKLMLERDIRENEGILISTPAPTQGGSTGQDGRPPGGDESSRPKTKGKPKKPSGVKVT